MGTHPIFESDFDCLTGFRMDNSGMNQVGPKIQVEDTTEEGGMLSPFRRTWGSFQRRKTTKEKVQESFSIGNDFKNRNITNRPDGDEFFNFIIFMIIIPLINFMVMIIAASVRDASI